MESKLKFWWLVLLKGIILVILSFYVFSYPVAALVGLALYIGISFLITGVLLTFFAISTRKEFENWGWRLAEGLLDIFFAFIMLTNPGLTASIIPFIAGFWVIFNGIILTINSFDVKDEIGNWWLRLIGGILAVVVGFLMIYNPIAGIIAISTWIGIGFFLVGIVNVFLSFKMRSIFRRTPPKAL